MAKIQDEQQKAKEMMKLNQKDEAKLMLRQKRLHEKLLLESQNKLAEIEEMIDSAENQQLLMDAINKMKEMSQRIISESNTTAFNADTIIELKQKLDRALTLIDEQEVNKEYEDMEGEMEQTISK